MKKLMLIMVMVFVAAGMAQATFFEDWENAGSAYYPTGWSHTGSGSAGLVTAGAGVGGSYGMKLTGEGTALDGYSRFFDDLGSAGKVELDFAVNAAGKANVLTIGEDDLWPRFDLTVGTGGTYQHIGPGYATIDTGIAVPGAGVWHHIVYEWYTDNTDSLVINGTVVPFPSGAVNHRAYGNLLMPIAEKFRFGVNSVDSIATWDNINVIPEPATIGLLLLGLGFIKKRG